VTVHCTPAGSLPEVDVRETGKLVTPPGVVTVEDNDRTDCANETLQPTAMNAANSVI